LESTLNRPEPRPQAITVVFDLDGTIADTAADLIVAANAALATEGLGPAAPAAIRRCFNPGLPPSAAKPMRSNCAA
jgi:phosphoglycolate phosphatase-like HAD superfamily hydrolase